ncbi:hypothetical protein AG0111_0g11491 [Alternaria gaisen]|uniref:Uncharacterized protein n=1 Tax=Alternaria gaisen TaxID=167740 RepID=A0ACB6F7P6_9PLEO|nr:hypothetical protein AG0111_0g11491 [Alternaria gaisen]
MEGHTYTIQLKGVFGEDAFELASCFEIVSHLLSDVGLRRWSAHMDFDWFTGDRPVRVGDTFDILPINLLLEEICYTGLILREVTDGVFERIGTIDIEAVFQAEMTTLQETQRIWDWVLPAASGYYTLLELQRYGLTRPTDLQKFFIMTTNNFV